MAKPKKAKNEDQKAGNSEAVVKHQKLCLSIDMDKRRIYGYTELEVVVPENGIVGLHADNLVIDSVTVDGEAARFEVFPHYLNLDSGDRWCSVSTTLSAADAAGDVYLSSLERELVPNLLIMCTKSSETDSEQKGPADLESELQPSSELSQNVKVVRIEYWVEKAETGIHFDNNVLHTDNQIRRARCWFPCMDDNMQLCSFDLEFTVACNYVAVSSGTLLKQALSTDDPPRKIFVYKLSIPVAARWISLAVAPFEILPDQHNAMLSHICLSSNMAKLQSTVRFFHNAFSYYEEYLSASFPFGCYTQVFISPGMAISSLSPGTALSIFSSQILFDEKVIDQTISTMIKLAYALARQWFGVYITPEEPSDDWLLDGLAGFLTDSYIKRFLGNNEARYRRYKANCAVCGADDGGATSLCSSSSSKDLYGTECIGFYGKIRSWKSVGVLQMLEKQMGPEAFRKILQIVISRAQDTNRPVRTLSSKEFRHFSNKIGNLERPFLKEFFPRWVGSCGCPVLKMGFSYSKRKNIVELAVHRGCTARPGAAPGNSNGNPDIEKREGVIGWPGMMSIRVHELDGMYDHPILPMAGDSWQLLDIQCHSKLAAKRVQKSKKGSKPDGSDDNGDYTPAIEVRSNSDSPLLWLRADPEMEYLADIHFNQPVQMWVNQLEKDKDVVAQSQAITMLEAFPQKSFAIVNALNNFLTDTKAFWRIRIEAAFAMARSASEETDWAGLTHLIKYYKSRRFDPDTGLPIPNDFHDFQEYFVLEAIPLAIAMVSTPNKKSPREAVEFILQLLKYNDNDGNPYTDVFWLAAMVQSVGELVFSQQTVVYLPSLLKRLDRLLQFDRVMPSYNGILTISCIRSLTQIAVKLSDFVPYDRVIKLIEPFRTFTILWHVRVEAIRALLDLEFHSAGIDAALMLFMKYLNMESSLKGQVKLGMHALRLCQMRTGSDPGDEVKSATLISLLRLLESPLSFNNVILRHHLYCILQVLDRRVPTLFGASRDETLRMGHAETYSKLKNIFAALVKQSKPLEANLDALELACNINGSVILEVSREPDKLVDSHHEDVGDTLEAFKEPEVLISNGDVEAVHLGEQHTSPSFPATVAKDETDSKSNELTNPANEPAEPDLALQRASEKVHTYLESGQSGSQPAASGEEHGIFLESGQAITEPAASREAHGVSGNHNISGQVVDVQDGDKVLGDVAREAPRRSDSHESMKPALDPSAREAPRRSNSHVSLKPGLDFSDSHLISVKGSEEPDPVSNGQERKKPLIRIKVKKKHSAASSRAEDPDMKKSQEVPAEVDRAASSSMSVDAPQRIFSTSNQNPEDVLSCHGGSRVSASIGSAKCAADGDELGRELQCTADSSKVSKVELTSTRDVREDNSEARTVKYASLKCLSVNGPNPLAGPLVKEKEKDKKKEREKKRKSHHNDPEYLEKKRLKKEKKRKEKEVAKPSSFLQLQFKRPESKHVVLRESSSVQLHSKNEEHKNEVAKLSGEKEDSLLEHDTRRKENKMKPVAPLVEPQSKVQATGSLPGEASGAKLVMKPVDSASAAPVSGSHKFKIKIKKRAVEKPL